MPGKAIHQISAGYTYSDAISNEARKMRTMFRSWGYESGIFSETRSVLPELRNECRDISTLPAIVQPDDIVLLHFSIGTPANDLFASLKCQKVLRYHNITPHHFFTPINAATAAHLKKGRQQIHSLAGSAAVNIAVSTYNARELSESGYSNIHILPIMLDRSTLDTPPDPGTLKALTNIGTKILFVGRFAPNKRIEDLVKQFYYYNRFCNSDSTLIHVGSFAGTERYFFLIKAMVKDLGLTEKVKFLGSIPQAGLNACYKSSDMFLSMSEHEGFCIPLIEAMYHSLPVTAFASSAVPDTMDGAGILFPKKDYPLVAETMNRILTSDPIRQAVIAEQHNRIERYFDRDLEQELKDMIFSVR